ncbi:MAG: hypothetical protein ACOC3V_03170 [bacterium]
MKKLFLVFGIFTSFFMFSCEKDQIVDTPYNVIVELDFTLESYNASSDSVYDGSILLKIDSVKTGTPPYKYLLYNNQFIDSLFKQSSNKSFLYSNLLRGEYRAKVIDSNDKELVKSITVLYDIRDGDNEEGN